MHTRGLLRTSPSRAEQSLAPPSAAVAMGMAVPSVYPNVPDWAKGRWDKGTWTGLVDFSLPLTCAQLFFGIPQVVFENHEFLD